jgi:hypothetical protein
MKKASIRMLVLLCGISCKQTKPLVLVVGCLSKWELGRFLLILNIFQRKLKAKQRFFLLPKIFRKPEPEVL